MKKVWLSAIVVLNVVCAGCETVPASPTGFALIDNNDGTVTDPSNNLIIQKCLIGQRWIGDNKAANWQCEGVEHPQSCRQGESSSTQCEGKPTKMTLWEAIKVANSSRQSNHDDWRLPSDKETENSLTKDGLCFYFEQQADWYANWTSLGHVYLAGCNKNRQGNFYVIPANPHDADLQKKANYRNPYAVRLVRGGNNPNAQADFEHTYEQAMQEEKKEIQLGIEAAKSRAEVEALKHKIEKSAGIPVEKYFSFEGDWKPIARAIKAVKNSGFVCNSLSGATAGDRIPTTVTCNHRQFTYMVGSRKGAITLMQNPPGPGYFFRPNEQ